MFLKTTISRFPRLPQLCNFSMNSMFQKSFVVENHDEFDKKVSNMFMVSVKNSENQLVVRSCFGEGYISYLDL